MTWVVTMGLFLIQLIYCILSFLAVTVAMISRDGYEIIGFCEISHSIKQPCRRVCLKKGLEMRQSCKNNAVPWVKQSTKLNILIYSKLSKFQASPNFISQPAVRHSSARCTPPDFSQVMYSRIGSTNLLIH